MCKTICFIFGTHMFCLLHKLYQPAFKDSLFVIVLKFWHKHWKIWNLNHMIFVWNYIRVSSLIITWSIPTKFSGVKSILAGIPLTNALCENRQFSLQIMFTSCPFNSSIVRYFLSKLEHMYLCGIHYQRLWPNCCKCDSFEILTQ